MPRILIVDDDTAGSRTLQLHLQVQGHATATAQSSFHWHLDPSRQSGEDLGQTPPGSGP